MSKKNTIPAGYRFTFSSWENDADNRKDIITEGISEREANLLGELASIILKRGTGLENAYSPNDKVKARAYDILITIFKKYEDLFDDNDMQLFKEDLGQMADYINEKILGYSEDYYLRVLDEVKVEYIPQEIIMQNVTKKFIKK